METAAEIAGKLDLASEPDFKLGALDVSPSACRVRSDTADQHVEPRVMEVLVLLARTRGRTVSRDRLVEVCWNGRIVSDDAIARIVAKVRALARLSTPAPFELETIPKVGFKLTSALSDGASSAGVGGGQVTRRGGGWGVAAACWGGAFVAAAAALLVWQPWRPGIRDNGHIEVIRFEARQLDPELRRVATNAGEAVIDHLNRAGLSTVSEVRPPDDGGKASKAELRVTGAVSRDEDGLAISTQILDRHTGIVLLSTRFLRPESTSGASQQTGQGIAATLSCFLEDRKRTQRRLTPEVKAHYLNTCDAVAREGNPIRMLSAARKLVAAEPNLAITHAMLAIAQGNAARQMGGAGSEAEALRAEARATAERAIELDAKHPKAWLGLAQSYPAGSHWLEREQALAKANALDPSAGPGRMSYVELLREVGRLEEGRKVAQNLAVSSDPRGNRYALMPAALLAAQTGDVANARAYIKQIEAIHPDMARGARWMALPSFADRDLALAELNALGPRQINSDAFACMRRFLEELPRRIAVAAKGLPAECARIPPERRIRLLTRQGDLDGAYATFATLSPADRSHLGFVFFAEMKAFRADRRFPDLVRRVGLADYWVKSGKWPDFCREPGLPYDCAKLARS